MIATHSSKRRSCDELGLCQRLKPTCPGCSSHDTSLLPKDGHYFAPGAIEGGAPTHAELKRAGIHPARRFVLRLAVVTVVLASCAYAVAYLAMKLGGHL